MLCEHHLCLVAIALQCVVEELRPGLAVPHFGATGRKQIVHRSHGVFGNTERLHLRQVQVHLRGGLGSGGELEHDLHAGDVVGFLGLGDQVGRRNQADGAAQRDAFANPRVHLPTLATGHCTTALEHAAAKHGGARQDVLLDGVFHETVRGVDTNLPGLDVCLVDHAAHTAEMIDVAVAVNHRDHGFARTVAVVQLKTCFRGLGDVKRVDDDQAIVTFDDGHVGQVDAAYLVDLVGDLEQAGIGIELRQAPQAGVHGVRGLLLLEEIVLMRIPHRIAIGILDLALEGGDQPAASVLIVGTILKRQLFEYFLVDGNRRRAGRF
ncbi:hypothetical protein D3C85_918060 [compost metagenome]